MCEFAVDNYISYYSGASSTLTLSAIDLSTLDDLLSAAAVLATAITDNLQTCRSEVRAAAGQTQHYDFDYGTYVDYKDLYDFARWLNDLVSNASIQSAALGVMSAIDNVVLHEQNSGGSVANSNGIAVYLPDPGMMLSQYRTISFAQDTQWDEFLTAY